MSFVAFFFPQKKEISSALKTYLGQISFLFKDFLNSHLWTPLLPLACQTRLLLLSWHFLKPNLCLKWSNHPLLALNSLASHPSPFFCYKLSYNDFTFSWIMFESIGMPFLRQPCTHRKAAFLIRDLKSYPRKEQGFCAYWHGHRDSLTNFLFFYNDAGCLLKWWATTTTDLNLWCLSAILLFLVMPSLFSVSWEHLQHY